MDPTHRSVRRRTISGLGLLVVLLLLWETYDPHRSSRFDGPYLERSPVIAGDRTPGSTRVADDRASSEEPYHPLGKFDSRFPVGLSAKTLADDVIQSSAPRVTEKRRPPAGWLGWDRRHSRAPPLRRPPVGLFAHRSAPLGSAEGSEQPGMTTGS